MKRWIATGAVMLVLLAVLPWRWPEKATRSAGTADAADRPPTVVKADAVAPVEGDGAGQASHAADLASIAAGEDEPHMSPEMEACHHDVVDAMLARALALEAQRGAREQLWAAVLLDSPYAQEWQVRDRDERAQQALQRAIEQAPEDPLVAWLDFERCGKGCDRASKVHRLLQLEPGNMAAWLAAMGLALDAGDEVQAEHYLRGAAAAETYESNWGASARLMNDAMGTVAPTSACERAALQIGELLQLDRPGRPDDLVQTYAGGFAMAGLPSFAQLDTLCPRRGGIPSQRLPACRAVYAKLASANELISLMIGTAYSVPLADTDTTRAHWRERLRNAHWLLQEAGPLMRGRNYGRLIWEQGEVAVMTALLEDAGRWPAPAGWLPDSPEARAAITGEPVRR